jgi:hypothetical protein
MTVRGRTVRGKKIKRRDDQENGQSEEWKIRKKQSAERTVRRRDNQKKDSQETGQLGEKKI